MQARGTTLFEEEQLKALLLRIGKFGGEHLL
jgi:hypothetical protein